MIPLLFAIALSASLGALALALAAIAGPDPLSPPATDVGGER